MISIFYHLTLGLIENISIAQKSQNYINMNILYSRHFRYVYSLTAKINRADNLLVIRITIIYFER